MWSAQIPRLRDVIDPKNLGCMSAHIGSQYCSGALRRLASQLRSALLVSPLQQQCGAGSEWSEMYSREHRVLRRRRRRLCVTSIVAACGMTMVEYSSGYGFGTKNHVHHCSQYDGILMPIGVLAPTASQRTRIVTAPQTPSETPALPIPSPWTAASQAGLRLQAGVHR